MWCEIVGRGRKFSTSKMFDVTEQLLLTVGYEGFTIGLLADELQVSRAAIYKYYTNKESLIADFMVERMTTLVDSLQNINEQDPFLKQLDQLLEIIFSSKDLHQILSYTHVINDRGDEEIIRKLTMLQQMHMSMYLPMQKMIEQGKSEQILNQQLANDLILGFIFQSVAIPNHTHIPKEQFLQSIKQMIFHGVFNGKQ